MPSSTPTIRPATAADLEGVSLLATQLVALHHQWDPRRFFAVEKPAEGYRWFLDTQLEADNALVLVAHVDGALAGYLYATVEPRDWAIFLDEHGVVHDVVVDDRFRRRGVASALLTDAFARLEAMGAPRVVLHTAIGNTEAHAVFERLGFRKTMLEMTRG